MAAAPSSPVAAAALHLSAAALGCRDLAHYSATIAAENLASLNEAR